MAERGPLAQRVHRYARSGTALAGRMTAGLRPLPDFLIVGAQRCGTTALYKTLVQHPGVMPAGLHKGIHFFDTDYQRGPEWYRAHFPTRAARALKERRTGVPQITGEASPYYMFHPAVPARMAHDLPDARFIVVLRDPVERAYSAYTHERARGFEDLEFEAAVDAEPERLAGEEERLLADPGYVSVRHQHNAYLSRGRYVEQLERLSAAVGRDRLLVVDADAMFADFEDSFTEIQRFLGLTPWLPEQFQKRNARPRSSMPEQMRRRLTEHFEPWDADLAAWWGRTPSWRQ